MKADIYLLSRWRIYLTYLHIGISSLFNSNYIELDRFGFYDTVTRSLILILGRIYTIYLIGKNINLLSYILLLLHIL